MSVETFERHAGLLPGDMDTIARLPMLRGLANEHIARVLSHGQVVRYAPNHLLFVQDEEATAFFILLDGWVKLVRLTSAGGESVIALIGPGESFAEAALFDERDYPVSAVVVEPARVLKVGAGPFLDHLQNDSELCIHMLGGMSRWLRHFVAEVEQLSARTTAQRTAAFLLKLTTEASGQAIVRLPTDKSLIAARLGMQPETLSRSLARLRTVGVSTTGNEVVISNITALRDLIQGT